MILHIPVQGSIQKGGLQWLDEPGPNMVLWVLHRLKTLETQTMSLFDVIQGYPLRLQTAFFMVLNGSLKVIEELGTSD